MNQSITLPKTVFEELVGRIKRLESVVFAKNQKQFPDEKVILSQRAKRRYKKMDEDFKKGRNITVAYSTKEFFKQLGI